MMRTEPTREELIMGSVRLRESADQMVAQGKWKNYNLWVLAADPEIIIDITGEPVEEIPWRT